MPIGGNLGSDGAAARDVADPRTQGPKLGANSAAASCGMVCVAILVQRSSDKSPAVRSKALTSLAGYIIGYIEGRGEEHSMQLRHVRPSSSM